mgnify:CR=1 FL=1|tara:strand:- start:3153 stop:4301 length:1149 start_codon:yes stop_codon:yes gene_type:complete
MGFKSVTIIGGSARNKGALLMLDSTLKLLNQKKIKKIYIFTPFPVQDAPFFEEYKSSFQNMQIIKWNQKSIIISFIFSLFKIKNTRINRALSKSSHVVDISGISFVSNRGYKHFIYNCISVLLPSMFSNKIIKFPQSFGPLNGAFHKKIAKLILDKCDCIYSRGLESKKTLDEINVKSVLLPDLGFINKNNNLLNDRKYIGIQPSIVVKKYFTEKSINYEEFLASLINDLTDKGYKLIIFPQAFHDKDTDNLFNDVLIIRNLRNIIKNNEDVEFIDKDLTIKELFRIYSKLSTCITSRFHGMIMSLISGVPPLVIGWNHKYKEVLEDFNLSELCFDIEKDLKEKIIKEFEVTQSNLRSISNNIMNLLPTYDDEANKLLNSLD